MRFNENALRHMTPGLETKNNNPVPRVWVVAEINDEMKRCLRPRGQLKRFNVKRTMPN